MLEHQYQHKVLDKLGQIIELLEGIEKQHKHQHTFQLLIIWKGTNIMSAGSVTLNLTAPYGSNQAVPVETENGQPFAFTPANIQWAVQNTTIASFTQNPDGSATFTPLAAGSTPVAVQDTSTGASAQGEITVVATANTFAMSITWQTPAVPAANAEKK